MSITSRGTVHYTALYGSGKGQYLEIIKNATGHIISERVVPEATKIKKEEESDESAEFAQRLNELKTLSTSLTKLHNLGKKRGSLSETNAVAFNEQMTSLRTACTEMATFIADLNGDYSDLFAKKTTRKVVKKSDGHYDYVEQEGVGIDASEEPSDTNDNDQGTIAEAKPVGLAVVGDKGLASSRPIATAISATGIALAKPIATAIAGIDPALLGINFEVNQKGE